MKLNIISNNIVDARNCLLEYLVALKKIPNKIYYYSKGIYLEPFYFKLKNEVTNPIIPDYGIILIDCILSNNNDKINLILNDYNNVVILSQSKILNYDDKLSFIYLNPLFKINQEKFFENKFLDFWNNKYHIKNPPIIFEDEDINEIDHKYDNPLSYPKTETSLELCLTFVD